ncbi:MAG: LPS assembly protein LptD [Colwellia sp.]|nr:LPS assembly protein LptD [Colwellia sp.]
MLSRRKLIFFTFLLFFSGFSFSAVEANKSIEAARQNQNNQILQCPIPSYNKIGADFPKVVDGSIRIDANSSSIVKDLLANFSGDVSLVNNDHTILADELTFNRQTLALFAQGNIQYQNSGINIFADKLTISDASQKTTLEGASYQLFENPGHGSANELSIGTDGTLSLLDSTYTTCLGEVPDWEIQASEIKISTEENLGQIYHAKIHVLGVPVLYVPYFSFPVTNERKTGFLAKPSIKTSSQSGLEIATPYYWNIAENMDATLTPHYMSKRGMQLLTEFRYLSGEQSGIIDLEYLNKDNALKNSDDPRYLARIQHVGTFSENFRAYVDYTTISDDNYLVDIGSKQYNDNDAYLYQIGELSYFSENWQTTLKIQDFEVLGNHQTSYKTLPQIELQLLQPLNFYNSQFELYSELSHFESSSADQANANRYHIEAGITVPISSPAWFLNSEFKLLQTYYQQEDIPPGSELAAHVSRTLPKIRFHGGFNLDRPMTLFNSQYTQTLEPQLQYLYVEESDQSNIGIYDTTTLQDDFDGLFRDRRNSGLDRIAAANQYSWGITSRILDPSNTEVLRFSFGQITYLDNFEQLDGSDEAIQESALAADLFFRLNHQWQISTDLQYDTHSSLINKSQISIDYRFNKNSNVQLNHRFTRDVSGNRIEQASLLTNFPINKKWKFFGRITQDLIQKRSLETFAGFQYESCCWAIRIGYHRHIISNLDNDDFINENRDEFDSGFMIQFVNIGFGGQQGSTSTDDVFNSSIFGYKRPYFLNN